MPLPMTTRGSLIAFPQSCEKCAPLRPAGPCSLVERWRLPIAIGIDGDVPPAISRSVPLGPGGLSQYISMAWRWALDRGGRPPAPPPPFLRGLRFLFSRLFPPSAGGRRVGAGPPPTRVWEQQGRGEP